MDGSTYYYGGTKFGKYDSCSFDLSAVYARLYGMINMVFDDCDFTVSGDGCMFYTYTGHDGAAQFNNCRINGVAITSSSDVYGTLIKSDNQSYLDKLVVTVTS